ncbi:MAG: ImmA/IrrE family metallo-endopeptidase [bacterium]|nr:ImmA/IrrE family metallo-endopeptidase [bacterium]
MDYIDIINDALNIDEPAIDVEGLIRRFGIMLEPKANLETDISGQIERLDDGLYKISANADNHYYRRRFTMAHELGHFLLHLDKIGDGADDDKMYRSTDSGRFYNRLISSSDERDANQFAAMILMPRKLMTKVWEQYGKKDKGRMAKAFKVSLGALEIRLRDLNLT